MSHAVTAAVVFLATTALSALFVSRAIPLCQRLNFLDKVDERRAHAVPMPRGGGAAIFVAFTVGLGLTFAFDVRRFPVETERIVLLLAGSALLTAVMIYDDALDIAPIPNLLWQIAAAGLVILPRLHGPNHGLVIDKFNSPFGGEIVLPLVPGMLLTLFWIVGMTNTLNWIDGLDGLSGSVTLVACAVLFAHTYFWPRGDPQFTISLLPLVLGAAVLGFLPFNWFPARIIMGDAGAQFIGFALAVISIIGGAKIATALLALGLPILDVAWVILYRIFHGRSPLEADRGHLHHRLVDIGWSHQQVVLFVAGVGAAFGVASLLLPTRVSKLVAMVMIGLLLLVTVGILAYQDRRKRGAGAGAEAQEIPR